MCVHIEDAPPECCETCKYGIAVTRVKRTKVKEPASLDTLVAQDPFLVKLSQVEAGLRCIECDTLRDHHGRCQCEREAVYLEETGEIEAWFAEQDSSSAGFVAAGALRRAHLKLGRDMPSATPGSSIAELDASASRKRYLGERKAFDYRRPGVSEPSELPI